MTTPVTINGALVAFDPLILKGDPGATGAQGATGPTGATTNLTMGTVSTVPNGQAGSASLTGTAPNQVLNLVIPTGPAGSGGGGAVTSVAGRAGVVVLAESDITGLAADLAAKATKAGNSAHAGALQVSGGTDKSVTDTSLTAGIVKTDANGVPSIAVSGTDYAAASEPIGAAAQTTANSALSAATAAVAGANLYLARNYR